MEQVSFDIAKWQSSAGSAGGKKLGTRDLMCFLGGRDPDAAAEAELLLQSDALM